MRNRSILLKWSGLSLMAFLLSGCYVKEDVYSAKVRELQAAQGEIVALEDRQLILEHEVEQEKKVGRRIDQQKREIENKLAEVEKKEAELREELAELETKVASLEANLGEKTIALDKEKEKVTILKEKLLTIAKKLNSYKRNAQVVYEAGQAIDDKKLANALQDF